MGGLLCLVSLLRYTGATSDPIRAEQVAKCALGDPEALGTLAQRQAIRLPSGDGCSDFGAVCGRSILGCDSGGIHGRPGEPDFV